MKIDRLANAFPCALFVFCVSSFAVRFAVCLRAVTVACSRLYVDSRALPRLGPIFRPRNLQHR